MRRRGILLLACEMVAAALLAGAPAPARAQQDWFRPPADVGSNRRTAPSQQAPARQQRQAPPQQRQQQESGWDSFPLFRLFQRSAPPPSYVPPPDAPIENAAKKRAPAVDTPAEQRGTVYATVAEARAARGDKDPSEVLLVLGDEYTMPLAQGLADAFATDRPDAVIVGNTAEGVGLVPGSGDGPDWITTVGPLAHSEAATSIIVMVGLNDLRPITDATGPAEILGDRWSEIYGRRVDDLLNALRTRNRPIVVVGLPPVQSSRDSDRLMRINDILKVHAEKAGATYVDVWDGFVDENGKFITSGPAVDGQRRRLRLSDGIGFARAGGRKLAFFVQRAIGRLPGAGGEAKIDIAPKAGPQSLFQLTGGTAAATGGALAGGPNPKPAVIKPGVQPVENPTALWLTTGTPLPARPGRIDDFAWKPQNVVPAAASDVPTSTPAPSGGEISVPAASAGTGTSTTP